MQKVDIMYFIRFHIPPFLASEKGIKEYLNLILGFSPIKAETRKVKVALFSPLQDKR